MAKLEISTLGPLQITTNQAPVSGFISDKVRALLVYRTCHNLVDPAQ